MIEQLAGLNRDQRRAMIARLDADNRHYGEYLTDVLVKTPAGGRVWRSRHFVVQEYPEANDVIRLTINRTSVNQTTLDWQDGITWDELQDIKRQCGYGDREAVEIYPPDNNVVNVGSMRHLWILPSLLRFSWKNETENPHA